MGAGVVDRVMLIVADDLGRDRDVGFTTSPVPGSEVVVTPTIASIYRRGVRINLRAQPWCSPSRATGITGRWNFRHGVSSLALGQNQGLLLDEMCLPRALKLGLGGDIETAHFGKWHLGTRAVGGLEHPNLVGFDHFAGTMSTLDSSNNSYFDWEKVVDGVPSRCTQYAETVITDDALEWLSTRWQERWYCSVNYHLPHVTLHRPPEGHYDASKYVLPNPIPGAGDDPKECYKAMIQALDFEIGRLLSAMPSDVLASTLVIFWSDNGTPEEYLPSILQVGGPTYPTVSHAKRTVYDWGIRVPAAAMGPMVSGPGRTSGVAVSVADLYSTVAEAMGADLSLAPSKDGRLDSKSFLSVLKSESAGAIRSGPDFGLAEIWAPNGVDTNAAKSGKRAIWSDQYKLVRNATGVVFPNASDEFYDLVADPLEQTNLVPGGVTGGLTAGQLSAYNALKSWFVTIVATP